MKTPDFSSVYRWLSVLLFPLLLVLVNGCGKSTPAVNPLTMIPDANFERVLVDTKIDKDGLVNGSMNTSDAKGVKSLWVDKKAISSLTGIEAFTDLEVLVCDDNQLKTLDVSKNEKLTRLQCNHNQLVGLDIRNNGNLELLECGFNALTELDLSKNINLVRMFCFQNQITALDVSKNVKLEEFSCVGNPITELDFSKNVNLKSIACAYCNLSKLNVNGIIKLGGLNCGSNKLTNLDIRTNIYLENLVCKFNSISVICVDDVDKAVLKTTTLTSTGFSNWIKDSSTTYLRCQ